MSLVGFSVWSYAPLIAPYGNTGYRIILLRWSQDQKDGMQMAKVNLVSGYQKQSVLFKNWRNREGKVCPAIGKFYITTVLTPRCKIHVHADEILCQVPRE